MPQEKKSKNKWEKTKKILKETLKDIEAQKFTNIEDYNKILDKQFEE